MPWNYISCSRLGRCLVLLERLRDESILEADSSSEARYYSITVSHPESDFHDHLGYTHTLSLSLSRPVETAHGPKSVKIPLSPTYAYNCFLFFTP